MKFYFGIRSRITLVIIFLIVAVFSSFTFMLRQIKERDELIGEVTENYQPSLNRLAELQDKFDESRKVFSYWMLSSDSKSQIFKEEFNLLFTEVIPEINNSLINMSDKWIEEDQMVLIETINLINDSLYFDLLKLVSEVDFNLPGIEKGIKEVEMILAESGIIFLISEIEQNLSYLSDKRNSEVATIFNEISMRTENLRKLIILISILLGVFVIFGIIYLFNYLRTFITGLSRNLQKMATGRIPEDIKLSPDNDFYEVNNNLNKLFNYLRNLTLVARRIGEKDFSTEFKPLGESDELGKAIVNLQESLKKADMEEKKYNKIEEERLWTSSSIARINDILRSATDSIEDLGYELVKEIVELTGAQVGGLFILSDEKKPKIKLLAAYAFERRKYMDKTIMIGEGLTGRCVQENETLYLTDVPAGHISIKSGLGESDPVSLLIAPLHLNEKVFGVIEIASFREMEEYQISFVKTICENIATTISNLQTNIHTTRLLEQTRQQAEKMLAQEEEMRQNMEEMKAKHKKFTEREEKYLKEIHKLKSGK